ncbi:MAG: hypothetical protein ACOZQL_22775 [Myxococcota bacterium]
MLRRALFLVAVSMGLPGCLHATRAPRAPDLATPTLTVVTWNVNFGLGAPGDVEALLAATADADLVLLQETNAVWKAAVGR